MEIADVLLRHGPSYTRRFAGRLLPSHRRAMDDIVSCRTEAKGAHIGRCCNCGESRLYYHSCRNRSCPKCSHRATTAWLAARERTLLPVPYFHIVFTVPRPVARLIRQHQSVLVPILMQSAAWALFKLASDERYVGGQLGLVAVLHTWTRALLWHPHVHCLVPGVGIDSNGRCVYSRPAFLVPVKAVSPLFRMRFMRAAQRALPEVQWPAEIWTTPWVVYAKPTAHHTRSVLGYLGRYVHKVAIDNRRIERMDSANVTFRYRDNQTRALRRMTLPAHEFIRRFLQHVLPRGLHKVRYYGLLSPAWRHRYQALQRELSEPSGDPQISPVHATTANASPAVDARGWPCPFCKTGRMRVTTVLLKPRAPP
jgi:hypothetical protein